MMDIFNQNVDVALENVKRILNVDQTPQHFNTVQHTYADKFDIAQQAGEMAINCYQYCFTKLGFTGDQLSKLHEWSIDDRITLRFEESISHKFSHESTHDEVDAKQSITTIGPFKFSKTIVHKIEDFYWDVSTKYTVTCYAGTDKEEKMVTLLEHAGTQQIRTVVKSPPIMQNNHAEEVDITLLFKHGLGSNLSRFEIDRLENGCLTPRRNPTVEQFAEVSMRLTVWLQTVNSSLGHCITLSHARFLTNGNPTDNADMLSKNVFIPVLALVDVFDEYAKLFLSSDTALFFAQFSKDVEAGMENLTTVVEQVEVTLVSKDVVLFYFLNLVLSKVGFVFNRIINEIEADLLQKLVDAIGETVTTTEMDEYMNFHCRKMFHERFQPKPFVHDIRMENYAPEGSFSLSGENGKPLYTFNRSKITDIPPIRISLGAGTSVLLQGKHHIHGLLRHSFSGEIENTVKLTCRARQFSSFIIMIGHLASADYFDPKCMMIIKNRDELEIMLNSSLLPSANEFRDSIASLSDQQQEFCKAYRGMQLESNLFTCCVIPIRPLLERILNLPEGCLVKELKLNQDILELFVKYQIPSDIIKYDAKEQTHTKQEMIEQVRVHVKSIVQMIDEQKRQILEEKLKFSKRKDKKKPKLRKKREKQRLPKLNLSDKQQFDTWDMKTVELKEGNSNVQSELGSVQPNEITMHTPLDTIGQQFEDYTRIPKQLESMVDASPTLASNVRPTLIELNDENAWEFSTYESLLSPRVKTTLSTSEKKKEKIENAKDLIDALTRSGELPLINASLHVVAVVTQCFDQSVMDTLVKKNVNPIIPLEQSALLVASAVHNVPERQLLVAGLHSLDDS